MIGHGHDLGPPIRDRDNLPPRRGGGQRKRRRSIVAMDPLAAFVTLLGFEAERGDGPGLEAGEANGLPGLFAVTINTVLDTPQGFIDL